MPVQAVASHFYEGKSLALKITFTDINNNPADPTNIFLTYTPPNPLPTTLAVALAAGTAYTTITVNTVPAAGYSNGQRLTIAQQGGGGASQQVVVSGSYSAGGTNVPITVASFTPVINYAIGSWVAGAIFHTFGIDGALVKLSTGVYQEIVTTRNKSGLWTFDFYGTGAIEAADGGVFYVDPKYD